MAYYRLDDDSFAFPPAEEADDDGLVADCQVHTDHLARFGAKEIPRSEYLQLLSSELG